MPSDREAAGSGASAQQASIKLTALKRRRATIKAACTRMETFVGNIDEVTSDVIFQLRQHKERLDPYWREYDDVQSEIETLDERESAEKASFEDAFYTLAASIDRLLDRSSVTGSMHAPSHAREVNNHSASTVRLPKLNLPTFSGRYDEWFAFHDTFNAIIHTNISLSDAQRFQYLRASLTGDALDLIHSLEMSDRNYTVAWNTLRKRYDDKRAIVHNHIKAILTLPTIVRENARELREISDGMSKHMMALNALQRPVDSSCDLIIHILSAKLDSTTLKEWQASLGDNSFPTLQEFIDFVARRGKILENSLKAGSAPINRYEIRSKPQVSIKSQSSHLATCKGRCPLCNDEHAIYSCREFLSLAIPRRVAEIRKRKLCLNCLRSVGHIAADCPSGNCRICQARHNTLLHRPQEKDETRVKDVRGSSSASSKSSESSIQGQSVVAISSSLACSETSVFLSTAVLYVFDNKGTRRRCRALLDSGSQANFITRELFEALNLRPQAANVFITGINNASSVATQRVQVTLQSRVNSFTTRVDCVVTNQITGKIPAVSLRHYAIQVPENLQLADPQFRLSAGIDMLIGADLFWRLLCVGQIRASAKHPTLQKTRLGWIVAGRSFNAVNRINRIRAMSVSISNAELHNQLSQFWRLEELPPGYKGRTREEQACEAHFDAHTFINEQGRYVVTLPVKKEILPLIGDSREVAMKRFTQLERRFQRDPEFKGKYVNFMKDYRELGHMKAVSMKQDDDMSFYLPHHGVFKQDGRVAKLRVVFDASCKSTTQVSLNDALMVGPVIQQDLISILIRFRTFAYVFAADIVKMYRQVLIHESQTSLQRILWREEPDAPIQTYELLTVAYGTSSASFLATRCVQHLALTHAAELPKGSECVLRDFYVDDLLTGADSMTEAKIIRDQVITLLKRGQFELSKWRSNSIDLIPSNVKLIDDTVQFHNDETPKILGTQWHPTTDCLRFQYNVSSEFRRVTKRTILSEAARLFDPLGLLGPLMMVAKLILQDTWQTNVDWDESLPQDLHERWLAFKQQLAVIQELCVSRQVKFSTRTRNIQLHGFCDASQRAYGACVYVRNCVAPGQYRIELLCSKSRVAPIKAVSLPRLELCAALLLARLIERVRSAVNHLEVNIFLWSDSTITLHWIRSSSRKWPVFVANRVGEIQRITEASQWRHVSSGDNPADVLSRGCDPQTLMKASTWWHGPRFLTHDEVSWPAKDVNNLPAPFPEEELRTVAAVAVNIHIMN